MNKKEIKKFNDDIKVNIQFFNLLIEVAKVKIQDEENAYEVMNGETIDGKVIKYNGEFKGLSRFIDKASIDISFKSLKQRLDEDNARTNTTIQS